MYMDLGLDLETFSNLNHLYCIPYNIIFCIVESIHPGTGIDLSQWVSTHWDKEKSIDLEYTIESVH